MSKNNIQTPGNSTDSIPKGIPVDFRAIITALIITGITSSVAGVVGGVFLSRSNTFTIQSHTHAIEKLEDEKLDTEVYKANQERLEDKIDNIKEDINEIKVILTSQ